MFPQVEGLRARGQRYVIFSVDKRGSFIILWQDTHYGKMVYEPYSRVPGLGRNNWVHKENTVNRERGQMNYVP